MVAGIKPAAAAWVKRLAAGVVRRAPEAVARRWPGVRSNAVDPGWVPTKMGGPGAPDDLELGHLTQAWLAASDYPQAASSGGYWYHQRRYAPAPAAADERFQDALLGQLTQLTGVRLP